MTPEQFRDCVEQLGWSLRSLAARLEIGETTIHRWVRGQSRIPVEVERWLAKLADAHQHNPAPKLELFNPAIKGSWK